MLITIFYTVPKTLRCDLQFCLSIQKSLSNDLPFCTTKPKSLRGYHYFYLTILTSLWGSLQVVSHCHIFEIRSTFLSRNVKIFVRWITKMYHSTEKYLEVIYIFVSHCRYLYEVSYKIVSECKKFWGTYLKFVAQCWRFWGLKNTFV